MAKVNRTPIQRASKFLSGVLKNILIRHMMSQMEQQAADMCNNFREGIEKDEFGLERLKATTIKKKESKNYPYPTYPLYGKGGEAKNRFKNMLRMKKIKNGFQVYPTKAKHGDSKLSLASMLTIHEFGKTFSMKNGTIVRIPPRPAFMKAQVKTYAEIAKRKPKLQQMMNDLMAKGYSEYERKFRENAAADHAKVYHD